MPFLQLLCLSGNVLNLLIYRLPYFDGSSSVHFLRAKALANLVIHAWTLEPHDSFEPLYWQTKPFVITAANISGTISTWMTLLVTIETVLCVLMPFHFRQFCTKRLTLILLLSSVFLSSTLHLTFIYTNSVIETPIIQEIRSNPSTSCYRLMVRYSMQISSGAVYEKLYYWTQLLLSIVIPTIVMLICSVLIVTQFTFKELGEAFSQRRKCVIRMTVATTLSHLLLEGPALLTFGAAALKGTPFDRVRLISLLLSELNAVVSNFGSGSANHNTTMCMLNHGNNLLSVLNATIPFFVFLACNEQFRHMTCIYVKAHLILNQARKHTFIAETACRRQRTTTTLQGRPDPYEPRLLLNSNQHSLLVKTFTR
ncbi:unnamed protein product [Anisakis simplex]|uniref:G_PROTEIN_RECEP_F1_2 domain-containing protein n=1 Tax=Anisakis simplex TaxID=6269 RepID=A0A158PNZ1_ANISI|nr:unnamed protein product [Anisakis simplex]